MPFANRERDFTSPTLQELHATLVGETAAHTEWARFWAEYGGCFERADVADEARQLDGYMTGLREYMSIDAPRRLRTMEADTAALDAQFGAVCRTTQNELAGYNTAAAVLAQAIAEPNFAATFNSAAVLQRVLDALNKDARAHTEARLAFLQMATEQYGLDGETAAHLWGVWQQLQGGQGTAAPHGAAQVASAQAIPVPRPDPAWLLELALWLLAVFGTWILSQIDWQALWDWVTSGGGTAEGVLLPPGTLGLGTNEAPYPSIGADNLPGNAQDAYNRYRERGWAGTLPGATPGTDAGGKFRNDGSYGSAVLPQVDADGNPITYREFDVNNRKAGEERDDERLVVGSDGRVYYTDDHYITVVEVVPEATTGGDGDDGGDGGEPTPPAPA